MTTVTNPLTGPLNSGNPAVQDAAWALRERGETYPSIARILGLSTSNVAYSAVYRRAERTNLPVPGWSAYRSARTRAGANRRVANGNTSRAGRGPGARKFGVEIECIGLSRYDAVLALRAAGFRAEDEGYNHTTRNYWKVVHDGSVYNGCEIVSPPMSGDSGYENVKKAMAALVAAGARIDRTCGLHVHHEVVDLTGEDLATLVETFAGKQATMNQMVAPSRRGAPSYCGPLNAHEVATYARAFRATGNRRDIRRHGIGGRPDSRYRTLNVHCYPGYGTIEFRQHQGTLNGAKAVAWIKFGQAFIAAVKARTDLALAEGADLLNLLTTEGHLPTEAGTFLTDRIAALA